MDKEPSEIEKLTERISRDPKSKLFVSLAEEYKKAGDIDMAIHVLNEGLKNNQGYLTARSFLGRLLIEKGDLPGAQKEFEEVVRAIPDNLMAQRKLADLYALLDRQADAVNHYKIALSLNPKDADTAKLLAEIEAGRDIKQLIRGAKSEAPAQPKKSAETKQTKPAAPAAAPAPAPSPASPPPVSVKEPEPAPVPTPAAETPLSVEEPEAAPALAASLFEEEEAEEILDVEPLEVEVRAPEAAAAPEAAVAEEELNAPAGLDFLSEPGPEPASAVPEISLTEQTEEIALPEAELFAEPTEIQLAQPQEEQPQEEEPLIPAFLEETQAETGIELLEQQPAEEQPVEEAAEAEKQADDFTTDTLAELYISQGFFEKAIDIYERMLADKPDSQGLKNKLDKVRAQAAAAPSAGAEEAETETISVSDSGAYDLGAEEPVPAEFVEAEEEQSAQPEPEAAPRLDEWEVPSKAMPAAAEAEEPERQAPPPKPFDIGFEPKEYIPPDAVPVAGRAAGETVEQPAVTGREEAAEPPIPERKLTPSGKKQTVDRLENWLKNIRKEN